MDIKESPTKQSPDRRAAYVCRFGCETSNFPRIQDKMCRKILEKTSELHANFECPHRMIKCELCALSVKAKNLASHLKEVCIFRQCPCPNDGCDALLCFTDISDHITISCKMRSLYCKQGCGKTLNFMMQYQHYNSECRNLVVRCPNNCGRDVLIVDLSLHTKKSCPMVKCII